MTRDDIVTAIQARGYGSDTLTQQQALVQEFYDRIAGMRRWRWLEATSTALSTTANQSAVSLAPIADLRDVDAVRLVLSPADDSGELEYHEPQVVRGRLSGDTTLAQPRYWTVYGGQLLFYPTPDKVYSLAVDYIKRPAPLAAGTSPLFDVAYHSVLVDGPCTVLAKRERDWTAAQAFVADYGATINEMIDQDGGHQRQTGARVKSSGFFYT